MQPKRDGALASVVAMPIAGWLPSQLHERPLFRASFSFSLWKQTFLWNMAFHHMYIRHWFSGVARAVLRLELPHFQRFCLDLPFPHVAQPNLVAHSSSRYIVVVF